MKTITERIAKHIRRGHPRNGSIPDAVILKWAQQYAKVRHESKRSIRSSVG